MNALTNETQINILLVDDRPENLVAMEALLASDFVNIVKCTSGEEALEYLLYEECALILLDVQMPGIDGYETAKLIKSRKKHKDTPIIFITAINQELEHVYEGYTAGAIDYIFKPFDPDVMISKVDSFVDMYNKNKKLMMQTKLLNVKTNELEKANHELSRLASELKRTEAMAKVIGETSMDTMIIFDANHIILTINPAVKGMFGYNPNDLFNTSVDQLFEAVLLDEYQYRLSQAERELSEKAELFEMIGKKSDGSLFPAEVQIHETHLEGMTIYACTIKNITEKKEQISQLRHMAMHDSLSGLPNRALLYEEIKGSIQTAADSTFALFILDLDHFKAINDTLGHSYGDAVLQHISGLIDKIFTAEEVVARLGGDEFAVLLPRYSQSAAVNTAKNLLALLERPIVIDGITLAVGASVGIVLYPEHGQTADELMQRADVAMYHAKRKGLSYTLYEKGIDQNDPYHLSLMGELRNAILNEELILYYQPLLQMSNKEIIGAEALVRWNHPIHGLIPPADFIPIAEQIGFMNPLTYWVLENSIRQCKEWEKEDIDINISVNLSVRDLQDTDFPQFIADLFSKYEFRPEKLQLEITESFLMSDKSKALELLTRMKDMGIKIAIDDFGTGYSSFAYIQQLPISHIKIDKSFVLNMSTEAEDAMIVSSIINLSHNLKMNVIAEGVEDEECWDTLENWGCDEAQGYFMSHPLPAAKFIQWLHDPQQNDRWKCSSHDK